MPFDYPNFEKSFSKSGSTKKHKLKVLERRNFIGSQFGFFIVIQYPKDTHIDSECWQCKNPADGRN